MGSYAKNTNVSPEKSQEEIRKTLRKYGADKFGTMEEKDRAHVMFEYNNMSIQITAQFPDRSEFTKTETGRSRTESAVDTEYEQAIKQRWRALLLGIKAKLEFCESGISTIEKEFMANIILPDGRNISDHLLPELSQITKSGKMPKLLKYGE